METVEEIIQLFPEYNLEIKKHIASHYYTVNGVFRGIPIVNKLNPFTISRYIYRCRFANHRNDATHVFIEPYPRHILYRAANFSTTKQMVRINEDGSFKLSKFCTRKKILSVINRLHIVFINIQLMRARHERRRILKNRARRERRRRRRMEN